MRRLVFLFCLLLFVGAGCGGVPGADPLTLISETATTRTFGHTFGTTEIPKEPQRVVALGEEGLLADLLDAGVKPVMSIVNSPDSLPLFSEEELEGIDLLSSTGNVSAETILTYNPDLIVASVFFADRAGYDTLSKIAPTVTVDSFDALVLHEETFALFGKRGEGKANVKEFEGLISAESERVNAGEQEISVAAVYTGPSLALFVGGSQTAPSLLDKMGVTMLPVGEERESLRLRNGRAFISNEKIGLLSGERLLLMQSTVVEGEMDSLAEMEDDPLWAQLPAVKNGNVAVIDRLGYAGLRGQKALLTDLVAFLEE